MARLSSSSMMYGASGKVGGLVFRQAYGKTVVQACGAPRGKRSELQQAFNDKMRIAAGHARVALRDPAVRAHYERKKKRLNVSSAYTAACTDFLRHGRIDKIDTSKYAQGQIMIKAYKAELGFEEVTVKIARHEGGEVIKGKAVWKGEGWWLFKSAVPLPKVDDVVITVDARDKTRNITRGVLRVDRDVVCEHIWGMG